MTRIGRRWITAAMAALVTVTTLAGCGRQPASPGVPLAGGDGGGLPRSEPAAEQLEASALQAAAAVAAQGGARVFLVARHGHLLLEHHASGSSATDLIDGGSMAQTLAALSAGAAVAEGKLTADTSHFDAASLAASVSTATGLTYADYVSQRVWQPLNAGTARFTGVAAGAVRADCCLAARAGDWLRLGIVLLQSGSFEGNTLVPAEWVARMRRPLADDAARGFGVWLPVSGRDPEPAGAEAFATRDVYFLRGADGTRLWLAPSLQLAVLFIAAPGATATDHTALFNQVIRAAQDRPQDSRDQSLLQQLVPGH
jgi:CubicO group peptidase (beta-lactamase class C family)